MTHSWMVHGRCNDSGGHLTALFFSEDPQDISRATYICATCPVLLPCLEAALERPEPCGVWGGEVFRDGRIVTRGSRRAATPAAPA
jgi:WhiB family redox-sensing transcriptional regulator